jgi:lipopolysaccharide export system protein LptA
MGNVRLNDGNRRVLAENMLLNPQADKAIATATSGEQVRMQSEVGEIQATRVDYELDTKWVRFPNGGTMQEQSRTATFDRGLFKVDDSLLELGGNVFIDDGDWVVTSDSLHWDEKNEKLFFHGLSHVLEQSGELELSCFFGAFDAAQEAGWFASEEAGSGAKARVRQDDVWLEADRLEVPTDSLEPLSANRSCRNTRHGTRLESLGF